MSSLKIDRMFVRDEKGALVVRRQNIWSSTVDACVDCGTNERPHEARGRCHRCYVKWRYRQPGMKQRICLQNKLRRMNSDYQERYDKQRAGTAKRKAQRREINRRWHDKRSPWPTGSTVWLEYLPGIWIKGSIITKTNSSTFARKSSLGNWIGRRT